jgi:hypothetical protein
VSKAIPFVPVAERVAVETLSTAVLVLTRKPVVFTDASFTEMSSAMVGAGKMTVSTTMAATDVTAPVAATMATYMTATVAATMATTMAATMATTMAAATALAP